MTAMAGVDHVRKELADMLPVYEKIDDFCEGERSVKAKGARYLPIPNMEIEDDANSARNKRYENYLRRAKYINFCGKTLEGLLGLVFEKDPQIKVPSILEVVTKNANGSGVSLSQTAKNSIALVIKHGRAGMLCDYPDTNGKDVTRADIEKGDIQPVILNYQARDIINWDEQSKGAKVYLTLVVLKEIATIRLPGDFEAKRFDQWRVLELVDPDTREPTQKLSENAIYRQTIWRKNEPGSAQSPVKDDRTYIAGRLDNSSAGNYPFSKLIFFPRDNQGKNLTEIPFTFIGAENNSSSVDKPPIEQLVDTNEGHYINSAEHEDVCYIVGQPTPFITGLDKEWIKDQLKGKVYLGSRKAVLLPTNATMNIVQVKGTTLAFEAMKHKEEQMRNLGAKFIEVRKGPAKTATEAGSDLIAENSTLGSIADNVEKAIVFCLEWAAIFAGAQTQDGDATDSSIKFVLNKKFDRIFSSSADRAQLVSEYQADLVTFEEARENLRNSGLKLGDDVLAKNVIKSETEADIDIETKRLKAQAQATGKIGGETSKSNSKVDVNA